MSCGLLLVNKPRGVRSAACVSLLRRHLGRGVKVGHGGTLDSTAEGLLILLVGTATRASDMVMALPKTYDATIRFGEERATDDSSGDVLRSRPVPADIEDRVRAALPSFYGVRLQTPPHMSAVKVDGRRASDRVRSGENLRLSPRPVHILSIAARQSPGSVDSWNLRIRCGKGTYVRSIARDMGRLVRCGAYVQSLVRVPGHRPSVASRRPVLLVRGRRRRLGRSAGRKSAPSGQPGFPRCRRLLSGAYRCRLRHEASLLRLRGPLGHLRTADEHPSGG